MKRDPAAPALNDLVACLKPLHRRLEADLAYILQRRADPLILVKDAQGKTLFYRWVARLITLPEETPDIADPEVREGLRGIIGTVHLSSGGQRWPR